jgi:nucleoside-diphosphate-sugar epimerase
MSEFFRNRRVLVTGGCGFIGSNLVRRLVECGARTTVVDNLAPRCGGRLENLADLRDRIEYLRFDLAEANHFSLAFERQEFVFCLAGATSHADSMRFPADDLDCNCRGPLALLETLRSVNPSARLVAGSTRQVYGRPQSLPVDESHPLRPVDINGLHMQAAEGYYRLYHELYGMRSVCLRLTNTYGPRMHLGRTCHGFVSVFFSRAMLGWPIELFSGGAQRRDFNHVDDVVDALLAAAQLDMAEHEVFNLGHDEPQSVRAFAEAVCGALGGSTMSVPFPDDRRAIDVGDYWGSYERFRRATGWRPQIDVEEGVRRTADYYRDEARRAAPATETASTPQVAGPPLAAMLPSMFAR